MAISEVIFSEELFSVSVFMRFYIEAKPMNRIQKMSEMNLITVESWQPTIFNSPVNGRQLPACE
jgi:hypothetical protein